MENTSTILTEKDKAILNSYLSVADGVAEFWGENCEVVVQPFPSGLFRYEDHQWSSFRQTGWRAHF